MNSFGGKSLWGASQYGDSGPDWGGAASCYNAWNVLTIQRTGNSWAFRKSSTTVEKTKTMTTGIILNGTFSIGYWPPSSGYCTFDFAELGVYNRLLTSAELAAAINLMGTKYGITIS